MQQVWVWLWLSMTMAFNRSTRWFEENICSARAEDPHPSCDWLVLGPWGWVFVNTDPQRDSRGAVANITTHEQYCIQ